MRSASSTMLPGSKSLDHAQGEGSEDNTEYARQEWSRDRSREIKSEKIHEHAWCGKHSIIGLCHKVVYLAPPT